jgi:hypothetical protein
MTGTNNATAEKELNAIAYTLLTSMKGQHQGSVEIEVLWSTMNYLKGNPSASIEEACNFGINEWLK